MFLGMGPCPGGGGGLLFVGIGGSGSPLILRVLFVWVVEAGAA